MGCPSTIARLDRIVVFRRWGLTDKAGVRLSRHTGDAHNWRKLRNNSQCATDSLDRDAHVAAVRGCEPDPPGAAKLGCDELSSSEERAGVGLPGAIDFALAPTPRR
jgi:hypothetical protein